MTTTTTRLPTNGSPSIRRTHLSSGLEQWARLNTPRWIRTSRSADLVPLEVGPLSDLRILTPSLISLRGWHHIHRRQRLLAVENNAGYQKSFRIRSILMRPSITIWLTKQKRLATQRDVVNGMATAGKELSRLTRMSIQGSNAHPTKPRSSLRRLKTGTSGRLRSRIHSGIQ
jgi:hypothetical protein